MDSGSYLSQTPSSQIRNYPRIFVDATGAPLPIFVESNGISDNRPKLIRTLRNHGAIICVDISLARIILVDPNTPEGRQFVRDWGMDPGKVILEVAWVRHSLEAGHALLENDTWGGCGNLDGTPLEDEQADEEEPGLFTNSNAVVLNGRSSPSINAPPRNSTAPAFSNGSKSSLLSTPHPTPINVTQASSNTQSAHDPSVTSSQKLPTPPSSTSGPVPPPMPLQSRQFPPSMPSNIPPNMPSNMVPPCGQLVPQSAFPVNALNPQLIQAFLMNSPDAMNILMNMMMMQGMHPNAPFVPPGWHGQPPPGLPQLSPGVQMIPQMQPQQSFPVPPQNMNGYSESLPPEMRASSPPVKTEPRQSMSPLPTFTAANGSDSDSPPPDQSILAQRGKKRARASSPMVSTQAKLSDSPFVSREKRREKRRSSFPIEGTRRSPSMLKRDKSPPIGIFTAKDGSPKAFFVQVQMRNRLTIIKQIKSNGGKIVADPSEADFILLDSRPGKDRDLWLKSVTDSGRLALRPGFIEACMNTQGLVEEDDFVIEPAKTEKRSSRKRRRENLEMEEVSFAAEQSSQDHIPASRTPSPPAVARIPSVGGRTPYTREELDYCVILARHILRKNPEASNNHISNELAKRVPRHPAGSWNGLLYRERRSEIDQIRQEFSREKPDGSSHADALSGRAPEVESQLIQPSETSCNHLAIDTRNASNESTHRSKAEQSSLHDVDLKTIVDFFADPPENLIEDDALWTALTQGHRCHTASNWQAFYQANQEVVEQRLREALNMLPEGTNATR